MQSKPDERNNCTMCIYFPSCQSIYEALNELAFCAFIGSIITEAAKFTSEKDSR